MRMTVLTAVLAALAAGPAIAQTEAPGTSEMGAGTVGTYGIQPELRAQSDPAGNEAQQELLDTQPQEKDSPDVKDLGLDDVETTIERTEMGSESGSPANLTGNGEPGDVTTNVVPGSTTEMGSGAGDNPDPIAGN